jgi:CBS domain-containing protein
MDGLRARDVMSTDLVTMPPETPVATIARLFTDRGLSAVPIVGASGTLVGIVTETDLVRRLANEDQEPIGGWLARLFDSADARAGRYASSHGATAREVMTSHVVTVGPEEGAAHIARVMEQKRIRRVVVVENGRVLGMVTRHDLVRVLLRSEQPGEQDLSDERIRLALLQAMQQADWVDMRFLGVDVKDGVAEVHGFARSAAVQHGLRVLAENVAGVRQVKDMTRPFPAMIGA